MAVSTKRISKGTVPGAGRRSVTEVTLDSSYQENGEPLTAKELGLRRVTDAFCIVKNGSEAEATTVGSAWYEPAKALLHVNDYKTQKEMASAKDLSKVVVLVMANGT